ncbi:hypothetical protein AB1N83_001365 [Pleurotus pulmonarius]
MARYSMVTLATIRREGANVPVCLRASGRAILYSWDILRLGSNGGDAVSDPCAAAGAVETPRSRSLVSDLMRNRELPLPGV